VSEPTQVLIVCSGNTCRSPLFSAMLASRLAGEPRLAGITVTSAGTSASTGAPASEGSLLVALERNLDLTAHRARRLTADGAGAAALILTMSDAHTRRVQQLGSGAKVFSLHEFVGDGPGDVPDPFGGSIATYRTTADLFERLLDRVVGRLLARTNSELTS